MGIPHRTGRSPGHQRADGVNMQGLTTNPLNRAVLAAGLGFFVDAFDLFLFSIYRIPSLRELGLEGETLRLEGERLLALQMAGMMVGGVLTGIIGDRRGRVTVLFGSILLYSLANLANAVVHDVEAYAVIRFLAGVGLAGELGAGITLVSESMTAERRGYGTILVATMGAAGAVCAGLAGDLLPWRLAFGIAGVAGLLLLLFRMSSMETGMFKRGLATDRPRGSFKHLFSDRRRGIRYLACIAMGVPIWYSVGLVITLSPDIAEENGVQAWRLTTAFILFQLGITAGDLGTGILSQLFSTRKRVILGGMALSMAATAWFFHGMSNGVPLYTACFFMGLGCGYLSVFATAVAEHFGTNLRVLATATVTNFMRGSVTLLIPFHLWLEGHFQMSTSGSLLITGAVVWTLALAATAWLPETYGRDLNYLD
jgi:MFS transporter, putative metabolite:H+ symporter